MDLLTVYGDRLQKALANDKLAAFLTGINIIYADDVNDQTKVDSTNTIIIGKNLTLQDSITMCKQTGAYHVVNEERNDFLFSLFSSCVLLKKPSLYVDNPLSFFNVHLNFDVKDKTKIKESLFHVNSLEAKYEVVPAISELLSSNRRTRVFEEEVMIVIDELLLNCFYHGNDEKQKQSASGTTSSMASVDLPAQIFLTFNESRLIVGCMDHYGSLDIKRTIDHLHKRVTNDSIELNTGKITGGLGLTYLIEHSAGIFVARHKNKKTLVATMYPLGKGQSFLEDFPRNIHFGEY